jgi:hypothetical protein
MEDQLKEYIVTLHRHEDLEGFYEDMETPGGDLYIPDRMVNVSARRLISRNTHYLLSNFEAELLKKDKRVWGVTLKQSIKIEPFYEISPADWDKSFTPESSDVNWGLLRCTEGSQISNWGDDGTAAITGKTAVLTSLGRNVDVVITDTGHPNVNHPEFAVNPDGTGGSRCQLFNWFQYNSEVSGGSVVNSNYPYPTVFGSDTATNHGSHVSGIAAGNTQGWAKLANIYNINVNQIVSGNFYVSDFVFDYVRLFHRNKPINSNTGIKNPTIVNASWGAFTEFNLVDDITSVTYRGQTYNPSGSVFTRSELESYGIVDFPYGDDTPRFMGEAVNYIADIEDAISEGVIIVGAAGNSNYKIDVPGGVDYNNYVTGTDFYGQTGNFYYHRGTVSSTSNVISVSNIGNKVNEERPNRVNTGPRTDIFAPGVAIISPIHNDSGGLYSITTDPRDSNYSLAKWAFVYAGATSMSSPQVTGVLACLLEHYPRMNQQDCRDFIISAAKIGQIGGDTSDKSDISWTDQTSLFGAANRYLYYKKQRETSGYVTAQLTNNVRKSSGMMFPRRRHI